MNEESYEWHGLCHICDDDIDSDNCSWLFEGTTISVEDDEKVDVIVIATCSRCAYLARCEREGYDYG
jgi:hypothetical protein